MKTYSETVRECIALYDSSNLNLWQCAEQVCGDVDFNVTAIRNAAYRTVGGRVSNARKLSNFEKGRV